MKIVVTADTHIPKSAKQLPSRLLQELETADRIIHAGDWQTIEVYEELQKYAPVDGVCGNVDGEDIRQVMPEKKIIEAGGFTIGIIHGHGEKKTTEKRASKDLKSLLTALYLVTPISHTSDSPAKHYCLIPVLLRANERCLIIHLEFSLLGKN